MASFQDRVIGALRLQPATFEEVEHDASATTQAAIIVAAGAVIGALPALRYSVSAIVLAPIFALIGWAIGSAVVLLVGTKLFPGKNTQADLGQMLRTMGFAQSPNLFGILGAIPFLGWLVGLCLAIWVLIAMVIAVRQALDYDDTMKAVVVCLVAWVIMFVITLVAGAVGGIGMVGASMM
jgi:hypothetical protein